MSGWRFRALALAAAATLGTPVVISCQLLLDHHGLEADPDLDATADASRDPCAHTAPPPQTGEDDDPSTEKDYWFATQQIIVPLTADGGVKPGLDLDNSCTCLPDSRDGAAPCETPSSTNPVSCDFDGGVDDAFGTVAGQYAPFLKGDALANIVNRSIDAGTRTFLVYLNDYNGKANDNAVGIAIVSSGGLYDPADCNAPEPKLVAGPDLVVHSPRWDGCDRWSAFPGLLNHDYPNRITTVTSAYVSNYTLVATNKSIGADFLGASVTLTRGSAVATLVAEDAGAFRLEGFITGMLAYTDAASVVGQTDVALNGGKVPLCASPYWGTVSSQLCSARDSMLSEKDEFRTGAVCDAVTTTIGFVARTAQVSDYESEPPQRAIACDAAIDCQ